MKLTQRTGTAKLPSVYVADMREELKKEETAQFLSDHLRELMEDRLNRKEQVILFFLNRRGYAGFISCRSCGYVVKCPHCDVSYLPTGEADWSAITADMRSL